MRIAILYNEPEPPSDDVRVYEANAALHDAVVSVERACVNNGWEPRRVIADRDPRSVIDGVVGADVVFNMVEAIGDDARGEIWTASLLEWIGVPFTGSGSIAMSLALNKPLAKAVLGAAGVRAPLGCALSSIDEEIPASLRYPLIVKPSREDASIGIELESVVQNEAAARARARLVIEKFRQPAIVEEFVPGRDITSALLEPGPELLPLREFDYSRRDPSLPNILTYDSKWAPDSVDFASSPAAPVTDLAFDVVERIGRTALAAWHAIGLRDYGRVDMRLTPEGEPVVIDVNTNPDLSATAGFADTAIAVGMPIAEIVARIVEGALSRGRDTAAHA